LNPLALTPALSRFAGEGEQQAVKERDQRTAYESRSVTVRLNTGCARE
jgi:hypothetical protein